MILPENSDEDDPAIQNGNLATIQELRDYSKAIGKENKFNAFLYKWNEKDKTGQFNHTKAISFDHKTAIIGSENVTGCSLTNDLPYNKEMSLFVDDEKFVNDLHKKLFDKDMGQNSTINLQDKNNWSKFILNNSKLIERYRKANCS